MSLCVRATAREKKEDVHETNKAAAAEAASAYTRANVTAELKFKLNNPEWWNYPWSERERARLGVWSAEKGRPIFGQFRDSASLVDQKNNNLPPATIWSRPEWIFPLSFFLSLSSTDTSLSVSLSPSVSERKIHDFRGKSSGLHTHTCV